MMRREVRREEKRRDSGPSSQSSIHQFHQFFCLYYPYSPALFANVFPSNFSLTRPRPFCTSSRNANQRLRVSLKSSRGCKMHHASLFCSWSVDYRVDLTAIVGGGASSLDDHHRIVYVGRFALGNGIWNWLLWPNVLNLVSMFSRLELLA